MIRNTVVALSIAAVATAGTASAQENATFTLRSGERMSGQLMIWRWASPSASITRERQIAANLAVIDFHRRRHVSIRLGSTEQWTVRRPGDGQVVTGQLTDTAVRRRDCRSDYDVDRDFSSNDVARIVLTRPVRPRRPLRHLLHL
jgi:hypothetical protein